MVTVAFQIILLVKSLNITVVTVFLEKFWLKNQNWSELNKHLLLCYFSKCKQCKFKDACVVRPPKQQHAFQTNRQHLNFKNCACWSWYSPNDSLISLKVCDSDCIGEWCPKPPTALKFKVHKAWMLMVTVSPPALALGQILSDLSFLFCCQFSSVPPSGPSEKV